MTKKMIFNSVFHLLLFIVKLPFTSIRFVYRSFVYICFSLPIKGGKFIWGRVGNVYDRVKRWKYGRKEEEKEEVIEGADADDQVSSKYSNKGVYPTYTRNVLRHFLFSHFGRGIHINLGSRL